MPAAPASHSDARPFPDKPVPVAASPGPGDSSRLWPGSMAEPSHIHIARPSHGPRRPAGAVPRLDA
jgi:hypothetical protein